MNKTLNALLEPLDLKGEEDIIITGIQLDSRKIKEGNLFVAVTGHESDGHNFIHSAITNGAVAVIGEKHITDKWPVPISK
ncbi:hypothetical protein JCM9140_315 [Halalkalibacter wakoensis JCM 9140]|uniref:Mur ligase N-terminal catalytic domain-containing protein n=1 Tax=Halalkalibacter wakoensis JCM 9140 TaxID=1236970 RepID=W4PX20_9BACI|nr:Mur ligase domain-containing protein [Halalkalibacter wakoensis]GAE24396.1 hypothetical protein JCM9140_315 [Halalkalibacter wakoensis JCM 9140]